MHNQEELRGEKGDTFPSFLKFEKLLSDYGNMSHKNSFLEDLFSQLYPGGYVIFIFGKSAIRSSTRKEMLSCSQKRLAEHVKTEE